MPTLTEPLHPGEFIATEANGRRSRENVTILSGQNLPTARVVAKVTASGKYTTLNPAGAGGAEVAVAVLHTAVDASTGDKTGVIMARDCELNRAELDFGALTDNQIATAITQLAAVGIIVRPAV